MYLHPHPVLPLAQLDGAGAPGETEMPVVAAAATRKLAFVSDNEAALTTLGEGLSSRDAQVEFEQGWIVGASGAAWARQ